MSVYLHVIVWGCLLRSGLCSTVEKTKPKAHNRFVATKEWKTIEEGQTVPSGLHYRLNLKNGKKEAKLIDSGGSVEQHGLAKDDSKQSQNLKQNTILVDRSAAINVYEEMQQQLLQGDQLSNLFTYIEFEEKKKQVDEKVIASLLSELQVLCCEADNADNFYRKNGIQKIIYKHVNSTNKSTREAALTLFATVADHRPMVKKHVVETGGLTTLLRLFSLEKHPDVKRAALKVLGVIIRNFPVARNKFVELGGLHVITESFPTQPLKDKVKMITLLYDLLSERREKSADLDNALYNLGWCTNFNELFQEVVMVNIQDFDSIEKCLLVMDLMASKCKKFYKNDVSFQLNRQFALLGELDGDEDHYFINLSTLMSRLFESSSSDFETNREL
ncbi:hypothetical protein HUJ04_002186 [Dendroctonus ponderosae]